MRMIAALLLTFVAVSTAVVEYAYNDPQIVDEFDLAPGDYSEDYKALLDGDENCWYLRFQVKSDNTVFVQFSPINGESEEYYEVMIGAWDNRNTCILKQPGKQWLADVRTEGVITGRDWQYLYIRQSHGYWEVGNERTGEVIAYGYDEDRHHIRYFRVGSNNRSWWKFYLPGLGRRIVKQDIHDPGQYIWHFPKFYSNNFYLEFAVKAGRDASLVFSPTNGYGDDIYEIIISAQELFVCLRRKKDEDPIIDKPYLDILDVDNYRYFWVSYRDGVIAFGRYGDDEPVFVYEDENPLDIQYFGITSYHVKSWWKFYLPCPEPLIVCEWESLNLKCPNGFITIKNALYGRENKAYCYRKGLKETKGCGDPEISYEVLRQQCYGKEECTIDAVNDVFGDPCYGTFKYLQLEYSCCHCD
ncbi:L-rhamnose-binding lectin ELEL-1 [Holothuria leucospilota]|uniref:L-rhamnose-binding lectin ELEL-1 n=1 Tax=Holothuria leucospilota TaxID=206669 RepID=A0A9Q0YFU5_HOLLE|nr:L-rhamnose-binding lectin ELEL-1 [Holothuria leucospilota]